MSTNERQIRYLHLRKFCWHNNDRRILMWPKSGLTVAYKKREDGTIIAAFAMCNKTDHYNKKEGRAVAYKRLMENDEVWHISAIGISDYEAISNTVNAVRDLRRHLRMEVR